jgi:hypothetical protein
MRKLPAPIFTNQSVRYDLPHLPKIAATLKKIDGLGHFADSSGALMS